MDAIDAVDSDGPQRFPAPASCCKWRKLQKAQWLAMIEIFKNNYYRYAIITINMTIIIINIIIGRMSFSYRRH